MRFQGGGFGGFFSRECGFNGFWVVLGAFRWFSWMFVGMRGF